MYRETLNFTAPSTNRICMVGECKAEAEKLYSITRGVVTMRIHVCLNHDTFEIADDCFLDFLIVALGVLSRLYIAPDKNLWENTRS